MPKKRGRALLVEDEFLVRLTTTDMMMDLGFDVVEAASGEEALKLAEQDDFDVILTDQSMRGMTGMELVQELRRTRPDTPVIIVSGFTEHAGFDAAVPRLIKPFRQDELAACLARVGLA